MITSAIICEFNPLHRGHMRLIEAARAFGADRVVCIMSGNFVQRGEPAIADKYVRAKTALLSGADLVLELPAPFAFGSAEYFARAGVAIADRLGFVDELIFGSESGDISALCRIADGQLSEKFSARLSELHGGEIGYASAMHRAYEELYGVCDALASPNNILAVEYIKALSRIGSDIKPVTVAREDNFSSESLSGKYPSATALRYLIYSGEPSSVAEHMPDEAYKVLAEHERKELFPIDMKKYGLAALSFLRLAEPAVLEDIEGISGGLHNRLCSAAHTSASYEELLLGLSTKKYTDSRLRRAILSALLGVKKTDMKLCIPFVRLLGASEKGRELLSSVRKGSELWVVTKNSDVKSVIASLEGEKKIAAERLDEISKKTDALYSLCLPSPKESGYFLKKSPFVEK